MQDVRSLSPSIFSAAATAALAALIFAADTLTALEVSFSTCYVLVVLMAARFCPAGAVALIAAGCVALTILGYVLTPPSGEATVGITNTVISIGTIVLTALLTIKDKTREVLKQQIANRARELELANTELESFAYSVSHDLRAPIRHILGYAELLQKHATGALDDKCQRYLRIIQESAKRMGNLIDDLLGFSRVGRVETRKTVISLEQLVREAISELGGEMAGREIAWKVGVLPTCYGDRSMLKLVLQNLIANAIKFTRPRARAEIEIGSVAGGLDEIIVFVRDNGVGFDMRYADKLFGVFQRLHHAEEFEGTGIGLAIVQRIVQRHGGEVRADSEPDRGATFYFSLPAQKGTHEQAAIQVQARG